jgi:hypothetical protein
MLTAADIKRQSTLAWCCLGKRMGDSLVMEKQGQKCEGNMREIGYGFLYVNAVKGYVPENDVVTAYSSGCQMNFEGNQFIVNSHFDVATNTFYEMYDATNAETVGSWLYFDATQLTQQFANGTIGTLGYTYDPVTGVLNIDSGATIYQVTYDKFFENIYLTDASGNVITFGFYGEKTLNGCSEVVILADKPCLGTTEVQSILNKASKNCDCNCEDYVNTEPTSKRGESLYLSDAEFNCIDGVVYMTINFSYSGSPLPNSFGIYVNGNIVYTFSDTGLNSGSFVTTVTSTEIAALAQNATYDITIYDNYGTTSSWASNTIESIPLNTCVVPEACCTICDLDNGQFLVSAMNINGDNYNLLNPPPAPYDAFMGTYITFNGSNEYTWSPITSDDYYNYSFDCESNVAVMGTPVLREFFYMTIDFNCAATSAKGYAIIEDSEGTPLPVIFTLQVSEDFTKDCSGECCNIETLNGYTLDSIGKFNYTGPDSGSYISLPAVGEDVTKFVFISESSVEVYTNNVLTGTYNYTYTPSNGLLYIESPPDDSNGYLQLTCDCGLFIYTVFVPDGSGGYTIVNFYLQSI